MARLDVRRLLSKLPTEGCMLDTLAEMYADGGEIPDLWEVRDALATLAESAKLMGQDGVALIPYRNRKTYGMDFRQAEMPQRLQVRGKNAGKPVVNKDGEAVVNWQPFVKRVPATFWESEAAMEALHESAKQVWNAPGVSVVGAKPRPNGGYFVTLAVEPNYVSVRKSDATEMPTDDGDGSDAGDADSSYIGNE